MADAAITIKSRRLTVRINPPGHVYQSSRFDWSSQVVSLVLDNKYEFLSREMADGTLADCRGHGLAAEFGIKQPVGYDDCGIAEVFPKIGAAWLPRKDLGGYDFYRHEPDMIALPWRVTHQDNLVQFSADSGIRRGYGWRLLRHWEVHDSTLVNRVFLENAGTKAIHTTEYAHNFVQLGTGGPRESWRLDTGFQLVNPNKPWGDWSCVTHKESADGLDFTRKPNGQFGSGPLADASSSEGLATSPWWKLSDSLTGLWMGEHLSVAAKSFEVWGASHVFSPELFVDIELLPGQSISWERRYQVGQKD